MATIGNWRSSDLVVENVGGRSPFSVVFGLLWTLLSIVFCFGLPFLLYFGPIYLFPNAEAASSFVSDTNYELVRESLQSFYDSTQGTNGILFLIVGFGIAFAYGIAALYGRASWRLFFLILGFAWCCLLLRYLSIDFTKTDITIHVPSLSLPSQFPRRF